MKFGERKHFSHSKALRYSPECTVCSRGMRFSGYVGLTKHEPPNERIYAFLCERCYNQTTYHYKEIQKIWRDNEGVFIL